LGLEVGQLLLLLGHNVLLVGQVLRLLQCPPPLLLLLLLGLGLWMLLLLLLGVVLER
jgi:hypothetical protein